VQIIRSAS